MSSKNYVRIQSVEVCSLQTEIFSLVRNLPGSSTGIELQVFLSQADGQDPYLRAKEVKLTDSLSLSLPPSYR